MKTILILFCCAFSTVVVAQTMTVAQTKVQIKKGDSLTNHGTVMLSEFMLMRDTARHTQAVNDFAAAKVIYDNCMANGQVEANDWGTTIASMVDAKLMILKSYTSLYGTSFRNDLMAETEKELSKKVKYNGTEYKVSKKTKERFDLLNPKK